MRENYFKIKQKSYKNLKALKSIMWQADCFFKDMLYDPMKVT